jgi:hypothetical protein
LENEETTEDITLYGGDGEEAATGSNRDGRRLNLDRQRPAAEKRREE